MRIAAVVSVGTATIAAAVGAGGLGTYVFRGIATVDTRLILAGAVPAARPRPGRGRAAGAGGEEPPARPRRGVLLAAVAAGIVAAGPLRTAPTRAGARVVVGSKNFTEQVVLGRDPGRPSSRTAASPSTGG